MTSAQLLSLTLADFIGIVGLFASVVSLALAVIAIWLSIFFYRMSMAAGEKTTEAADAISANVGRLDALFDKLYSDTFSMMRDTVSDMRKQLWTDKPEAGSTAPPAPSSEFLEEMERRTDVRLAELRTQVEEKLEQILLQQALSTDKVATVREEMKELIATAMHESKAIEVEALEETVRERIWKALKKARYRRSLTVKDLWHLAGDDIAVDVFLNELAALEKNGQLEASGEIRNPNTSILVSARARRAMRSLDEIDYRGGTSHSPSATS
ncbi:MULTISPECIES: hypothetical protein [Xanthomonas]|uniref:hypothetical protein n=1 Tax=Xanthomonas TaxID=338 RepID=UPI000E1E85DC|nr:MULTISPECIES: hypothetical protein [Xanthomonas]